MVVKDISLGVIRWEEISHIAHANNVPEDKRQELMESISSAFEDRISQDFHEIAFNTIEDFKEKNNIE